MAKVKIQGHASGTGILTVTAPNTSTDRTITLPDGTGTLIADDGSGNLGINTTTPSSLLEVKAGSNSTTDYPITVLNSAESVTTGYGAYGIDQSASSAYTIDVHDDLVIKSNTGENLRVLENGGITFNGDTAAANALDDYEEGTWSPDMKGNSGSAGSAADNGGGGFYVKVGNLVYVSCQLYMTNKGSYSGNLVVEGLPFTAGYISSGSITSFPSTEVDAEMRGLGVPANYSRFEFFKGSRLDLRVPWSEVVTSYYLTVSATYRV